MTWCGVSWSQIYPVLGTWRFDDSRLLQMSVVLPLFPPHSPRKFPDQIQWVGREASKWETDIQS
jgi:hypothetical protein